MKTVLCLLTTMACSIALAQNPPATASQTGKNPATTKTAKPSTAEAKAQQAAPGDRPTREQIVKLLDLLQIRDSLQLTLDAEKGQLKNGAVETFREKVPVPTPDQLRKINQIVDEAFAEISMDDLIRDMVPVYQKHLSRGDVTALINFYSSPTGQRIRREQPAMMRESMQATSAAQQEKMEMLLTKIEARMQLLVDEEQKH